MLGASVIFNAKLGETQVEVRRSNRWRSGILVGRSRSEVPKVDVILDDRTVLSNLDLSDVRLSEI